ncbi:hypothetical protein DWY33_11925 [Dorea formicigenerans]|uniref:Uncharacterized protein n=1 Tax=Dorea formicigenerans TaxID=39486 RepID=A0A412EYD5_9FIRM|nr:hypothetical protein DWY33_11925 [Dorea formicigenerans]
MDAHQKINNLIKNPIRYSSTQEYPGGIFSSLIQECLGILAARCASCNCMTYFYCAPLQSCRRLYQLGGIDSHH